MKLIEQVSLYVLVVLAGLRPIVAESYDSAGVGMTMSLEGVADPSPLATMLFDLAILLATCGWLATWLRVPQRRFVSTGLELGLGVILVAAVVSCVAAGNKRLAINASFDWICIGLHAIGLVQLMRTPFRRGLLLAVILASATAQSAKCLEDRWFAFDETWQFYQEHKEEFWGRRGIALDSSEVELFERRMQAREAHGYFAHSNVAGSYLVLSALPALGVAIARWRRWRPQASALGAIGASVGVIALLAAAVTTKSNGALIAGAIGILLWRLHAFVIRDAPRSRHRKLYWVAWSLVVLSAAATVGHGCYHRSLPGASLNFRWQYWTASAPLIADYAATGVGRENFGRHYVAYKPIDAPEEISNPHNVFVQAAAEWGVVGLAGIVILLLHGTWRATVPQHREESETVHETPASIRRLSWSWGVCVLLGVLLARLPLLGSSDVAYLYWAQGSTALAWLAGFAFFMNPYKANEERTVVHAAGWGLFAFLLYEAINFALFVPGSATAAFALFAFIASGKASYRPKESGARRIPTACLIATAIAAFLVLFIGVIPIAKAEANLQAARQQQKRPTLTGRNVEVIDHYFRRAIAADPWDPTPCAERARWWLALANTRYPHKHVAFSNAGGSMAAAIARDPYNVAHHRLNARVLLARAQYSKRRADYLAAVGAARAALARYPTDPQGFVLLGDCQLAAAGVLHNRHMAQQAADSFRAALALDNRRPEWERIRGLNDRQRREINERIAHAVVTANSSF